MRMRLYSSALLQLTGKFARICNSVTVLHKVMIECQCDHRSQKYKMMTGKKLHVAIMHVWAVESCLMLSFSGDAGVIFLTRMDSGITAEPISGSQLGRCRGDTYLCGAAIDLRSHKVQ